MTRWSQRLLCWEKFLEVLNVIVETLTLIRNNLATLEQSDRERIPGIPDFGNDRDTRTKASLYLKGLADPTFVAGLVCLTRFLGKLKTPTRLLQKRDLDIMEGYSMIADVVQDLQETREIMDTEWEENIWPDIQKTGDIVGAELIPPRRPCRSIHRDNTPGEGSTYFKRAVGIPVVDEILSDLKQRFGKDQLTISKLLTLNPEILVSKTPEEIQEDLGEGLQHFSKFFPDGVEEIFREIPILQKFIKRKE